VPAPLPPFIPAAADEWSAESQIRFSFADPTKTISASQAQDILMRWHKRNPANFGNELAETMKRWALYQYAETSSNGRAE
jgi:hypothetical protein